jgi:transcriptional regulatory protein LevR
LEERALSYSQQNKKAFVVFTCTTGNGGVKHWMMAMTTKKNIVGQDF